MLLPVGIALLVAACGSATPTTAPGETPGPGQTTAATNVPPGETQAPVATPGGPGPGTADACALLTADEVTEASGFTDIDPQPVADEDTDAISACGYVSQGAFPAAILTILDPENTNTDPAGYLALPGSEEVSVSGARAVWVPAAGNVMFVIKGGTVATILISPTEGEFKDAALKVVQKVADRL